MPIQMINDPNRSFGASLGQNVGGGLGAALSYLAQKKIGQLEQRQRTAEQQALFQQAGYSPEQSALLSSYSQHPGEQLKLAQMLGQVAPQQQEQPTFFQQQPGIQQLQEPMAQLPQRQSPQWMQGLQGLSQGPQDPGVLAQQSLSQRLGLPELPTSQFGRQLSEALQQGQLQPELVNQQQKTPVQSMPVQQQAGIMAKQQAPKTVAQQLAGYQPPALKQQRELAEQKQEIMIRGQDRKYLEKIEENSEVPRRIAEIADEALKLLQEPVFTGIKGKLTPAFLQTEAGQQLTSKLNRLVLLEAQLGKGVPSKMRLQMEELSKPSLWQKPQVIKKLLKDIRDEEFIQKAIAKDEARQQIIGQIGERYPKNIPQLVEQRSKEILKKNKVELHQPKSFTELPDASKYPGKIARSNIGERLQSINGQWVPMGA